MADSNGWTALHHACKYGDYESVKFLLDNYASVNKFSNKGYYPIHVAALFDKSNIIKLLLECEGVKIDVSYNNLI